MNREPIIQSEVSQKEKDVYHILMQVGDGQGGLACCGSWGHKESDTTEQQN